MSVRTETSVADVCRTFGNRPEQLLDIVREVSDDAGFVDPETIDEIATLVDLRRVDVESLVSFYSLLSDRPTGRIVFRICNDVVDVMMGASRVLAELQEELGVGLGETTPDGAFALETTSCIGLCDQAPAALVQGIPVPRLTPGAARRLVGRLRERPPDQDLRSVVVPEYGDGNNAHDLVRVGIHNNLRLPGPVIFDEMEPGSGLWKALALSPAEVIRAVKAARLRGRGGAGFPTGMKWEATRSAPGDRRVLIANADEGEPGTFKDRVILTERPDLLFEGMAIAGYAIGASEGILYLRAEYDYLRAFLERVLEERRAGKLLGENLGGRGHFDFDIRIQMGAGAYVCGEETALINSCEGLPGVPRNRPPFPAQAGYLGRPTSVNNVETLCCAARILEKGPAWFSTLGTPSSTGTKLLSISGDCRRPGVYELPFGVSLREVLQRSGAEEPRAIQIGGPSGRLVGVSEVERTISFEDLPTGGAVVVFGPDRDLVEIAHRYTRFFAHESCGFCAPCRAGTPLLAQGIGRVLDGRTDAEDLATLTDLGRTIRSTSRCGLGQTAANPLLTSLEAFPRVWEERLRIPSGGWAAGFDLDASLGRGGSAESEIAHGGGEPR